MGEFGESVVKHFRAREDKEDSDSRLRSNGSEVGKDKALLPDVPDVPDALRSTREALDLVVACMVALLLLLIVLTIVATIVTRLVDFFKQRKQMKANFGGWRRKDKHHPSSRPLSRMLAHSPLTSPKSTPLPPTGPYRAVPKPPGARVLPKMVPPSAPPAERDFLVRP